MRERESEIETEVAEQNEIEIRFYKLFLTKLSIENNSLGINLFSAEVPSKLTAVLSKLVLALAGILAPRVVSCFRRNFVGTKVFTTELSSTEYSVEITLLSTEYIPSKIIPSKLTTFLVVTNEIVEVLKRSKKEGTIIKLYFEKAYGKVDWVFLLKIMEIMRIELKYIYRSWIKECLASSCLSMLINGAPTKEFGIEMGLAQGDPCHLFYFCLLEKC